VAEEIFLTNRQPYLERTRLFAGAGYSINNFFTIQAGWIRQFDFRSNSLSTSKNMLQVSLLFDIKPHKSGRERHPSSMD
jgi:hypothetical protein